MAVCIEQDLERHSQIACRLPRIRSTLHQPGRRGVSQRVRRDTFLKSGEPHRALERRLHGCHRLVVELDEVFRIRCNPMPASKMSEQTRRNRYRRLPLVGPRAPLLAAVIDAAIQINESPTDCWNRRSRSDGTGTRSTVNADQDKPCKVSQRPLPSRNLLPFHGPTRHLLYFPVAPAGPDQFRSIRPCEPFVTRLALCRQCDLDNPAVVAFSGVMIDSCAQIFKITP